MTAHIGVGLRLVWAIVVGYGALLYPGFPANPWFRASVPVKPMVGTKFLNFQLGTKFWWWSGYLIIEIENHRSPLDYFDHTW